VKETLDTTTYWIRKMTGPEIEFYKQMMVALASNGNIYDRKKYREPDDIKIMDALDQMARRAVENLRDV
jgi:hypothetical protein